MRHDCFGWPRGIAACCFIAVGLAFVGACSQTTSSADGNGAGGLVATDGSVGAGGSLGAGGAFLTGGSLTGAGGRTAGAGGSPGTGGTKGFGGGTPGGIGGTTGGRGGTTGSADAARADAPGTEVGTAVLDSGPSTDGGSTLSLVITPSRISGVAPLAVFFDTTSTPSFADGSFVDATVEWSFDVDDTDPKGHYREASGFLVAHVFDQPGSYRVRAQAHDAQGRTGAAEVTIVAQAFSGTTYYVAENGADGSPGTTMTSPVKSVQHAIQDLAKPNTRVLFRKGDTFNTREVSGSAKGPVIIGSYEDPQSPSSQAPILYSTAADNDWSTLDIGEDWRVMDLHIRSGGSTGGSYGDSGGPRYPGGISGGKGSLIYRVEFDNLAGTIMNLDGNTVAECDLHDFSGYGWYSADSNGGAVIGNRVHDMSDDVGQHIFRMQGGSALFLAWNEFGPGAYVNYDTLTIRGNADKVVIYRNVIHDWLTGIWPQNRNSADEYQHHCVVDANLFLGASHRGTALALHAKDIVVRNNVFYNYQSGISIENDTVVGPSQRIKVQNNTFISGTPNDEFAAISVDSECFDVDIVNNLMLDAAGTAAQRTAFLYLAGGTKLQGVSDYNAFWGASWKGQPSGLFPSGTLSAWQAASGLDAHSFVQDPTIAVTDPAARADGSFARPAPGSPAIGSGAKLPSVALDFYGNPRAGSADRGAVTAAYGTADGGLSGI
jgi:hypothetical protein